MLYRQPRVLVTINQDNFTVRVLLVQESQQQLWALWRKLNANCEPYTFNGCFHQLFNGDWTASAPAKCFSVLLCWINVHCYRHQARSWPKVWLSRGLLQELVCAIDLKRWLTVCLIFTPTYIYPAKWYWETYCRHWTHPVSIIYTFLIVQNTKIKLTKHSHHE